MLKAFTLIELLIVCVIIIIITSLGLVSFSGKKQANILEQATQQLISDIRLAQNMSMSEVEQSSDIVPRGYGVYMQDAQDYYIIFADTAGAEKTYQSSDVEIKKVYLNSKLEFLQNPTNIFFQPPNAYIFVDGNQLETSTKIIIKNTQTLEEQNIIIKKFGQINAE